MYIVTEGQSDKIFLQKYCKYMGIADVTIEYTGGKDNIQSNLSTIKKRMKKGEKICIIFDADSNIEKSKENIIQKLISKNDGLTNNELNSIEIFMLPNNKDCGTLETLMEEIAKFPDFINCFNNYERCLQEKKPNLKLDEKSRIYAYLEAMDFTKNIKEITTEKIKECFEFDNIAIHPLKFFLEDIK